MGQVTALVLVAAIVGLVAYVLVTDDETGADDATARPVGSNQPGDPIDSDAADGGQRRSAAVTLEPEPDSAAIPILGRAPEELVDIDGWLNTEAASLAAASGEVTIVQFWTFGCRNCKNTLPHLKAIYDQYGDQGLEVVGVHAPEFDYEADPENVAEALVELGIPWPVALDTDKRNFRSWQEGGRRFWPRTYVVDIDGNIRFDHIGEGAYDELEETVAQLLAEQV